MSLSQKLKLKDQRIADKSNDGENDNACESIRRSFVSSCRRRTPRTDTCGLLQPEQEKAADEREKKLDSSAPTPPPVLASPEQSPA